MDVIDVKKTIVDAMYIHHTSLTMRAVSSAMSADCDDGKSPSEESIRVCVRVRPLNEQESAIAVANVWDTTSAPNTLRLKTSRRVHGATSDYTFDSVFGVDATSDAVYEDIGRPLVDSAMGGMNATVFAYGQTGSGKTFTMRYVTSAAGNQIFRYIATATSDRQYLIK